MAAVGEHLTVIQHCHNPAPCQISLQSVGIKDTIQNQREEISNIAKETTDKILALALCHCIPLS